MMFAFHLFTHNIAKNVSVTTRAVPICTVSNIRKCGNFWIHSRVMPTQAIHHTGLQIRAFIAFLYRIILELMPLRLIPRLKSSSWKLAVRRPPAISSSFANSFIPEHVGFDQWKASTREHSGMIFTEERGMTIMTPRIASWGYAPP